VRNNPHFHVERSFSYGSSEELDSYLYQTVGQDAIEFVARALDVPLYRRVISGTALVQESEYGGRDARERGGVDGDETEDLYALLAHVKVMQTLSMRPFSPVKHVVCCSPNILM
jgi:diphthamide synthase (EF-2-diphthine--ammonia ligase)